jgi:hypothetical protein
MTSVADRLGKKDPRYRERKIVVEMCENKSATNSGLSSKGHRVA